MKRHGKNFVYFSRGERRALILLILLIGVVFLFPSAWLKPAEHSSIAASDREWLESAYKNWQDSQAKNKKKGVAYASPSRMRPLQRFDPNKINVVELQEMGVPQKIAQNWSRYLQRGGKFRNVRDVRKIYGMDDGCYQRIEPFLLIASERDSLPGNPAKYRRGKPGCIALDINLADSISWESLPGIGPVLAGRIVRFRDRLGGFHSITQVSETFGLPDSTYQRILPCLQLDAPFQHLEINHLDEVSLRAHPYVGYKLARMLVNYRMQHGAFTSADELLKLPLMDTLALERLKPYIRL